MPYEADWKEESLTKDDLLSLAGTTVLEFGADWCPHCQAVQSTLQNHLHDDSKRHLKIADGKGKRLGRSFGVKLWPNFVLIKDGEVQQQLARPSLEELSESLKRLA